MGLAPGRIHVAALAAVLFCMTMGITTSASAQSIDEWVERCRSYERLSRNPDRERVCKIRQITLPATGAVLRIDGEQNGGIAVRGWDRDEILVQARITANAATEAQAHADADAIRILTNDHSIRAHGPDDDEPGWWSVSYRVFVPWEYDLSLRTHNGGIEITEVQGRIDFQAQNGGISLSGLGGDVRGSTTNGGLDVELDGERWRGEGLDVETTNGGIELLIPPDYSARLQTGTVNGRIETEIPLMVRGNVTRQLSTELGSGGPPIRAETTNGSVSIHYRE